ncbi:MAG: Mur ligase family protein, partial [Promicromonosporaceae bacterium]|nr:Mur ligase family protein [Promicromonosporaceae bacterium]
MTPARLTPETVPPTPLAELVDTFGLRLVGDSGGQVSVTGIASDNRVITPGDLFAALPGAHVHGASFAADAVGRGAVGIITDDEGARVLAEVEVGGGSVPVLVSDGLAAVLGPLASRIYGEPSNQVTAFAVTGTNGKTTTVYLLCELLALLGERTGLIGTVEMQSGDRVLPAGLTTPQAVDLQAILATMVADGVTALAMEVSSHALELHRVAGVKYAVAGFTNLSQDHLDFHQTMDAY